MKSIFRRAILILPVIALTLPAVVGCKAKIAYEKDTTGKWEKQESGKERCVPGGDVCPLGKERIEVELME